MKKLRKLSALFLVACLLLTVVLPVAAADAEAKELELRCVSDHPGVYGYDVTYTFNALYGTEMDKDYLKEDAFELYCAEPAIIIEGNTVTVPASFKDNTDIDGIKIYAKYEDAVTYYPLMIKNWEKTFEDEFEGDTLDETKWQTNEGLYAESLDIGEGKTCTPADQPTKVEDGNLVLSIQAAEDGKATSNGKEIKTDYVYSRLTTKEKFDQRFGLFSTSIKLPTSTGAASNTAFWLCPTGTWGKTFAASQRVGKFAGCSVGEIDTIEFSPQWNPVMFQVATHWWDDLTLVNAGQNAIKVKDDSLLSGEYINMSTVWTPNSILTYYNGQLVDAVRNLEAVPDASMYMLYTLKPAGYYPQKNWVGSFTDEDLKDIVAYVDWCRAYK